jgi:hypothetical protein
MLLGRMKAHRCAEFTGGSGSAAADAQRGKEAGPALLGEEARSTGEPLMLALLRWSAGTVAPRVEGHSGLTPRPAHAEAAVPSC